MNNRIHISNETTHQFLSRGNLFQKILDALPGNYRALVFLGKAAEGLNQFDHALKAYRQAIDASPEEMIAWQGLNKLYEKNPPSKTKDHTEVFEKLVLLTTR